MQRNIIALMTVLMLMGPGFTLSPVLGSDPQDSISNGESISSAHGNAIMDNTHIQDVVDVLDGTILYVGGTGDGNYSSIQDAIDNASDGDTVFVYNGTYYEKLSITKSIDLCGEDRYSTIIDSNDSGDVITINYKHVRINGFTITNGSEDNPTGHGIEIKPNSDDVTVENCIISKSFNGIYLEESSRALIQQCEFVDNLNGLLLMKSNNSELRNCIFGNRQFNLWIHNSDNNHVDNCTLKNGNTQYFASRGIDFTGSSYNVAENCVILNTWDGISFYMGLDEITSDNNIIQNCIISENYGRGIVFGDANGNQILKSTISNNGRGGSDEGYAIEFFEASNSIVEDCQILDNPNGGIKILWLGYGNSIFKSTISNNGPYGIMSTSNSNHIYSNNFLNNDIQVYDQGDNNVWDNEGLGNYWDDYNGVDEDGDGIGDTAYDIMGGNDAKDNYPLMFPYGSEPNVKITTPLEGYLYVRNFKISPFFTTLIFGNIQIEANAANYVYGIDYVEFYVDGRLRSTDTTPPYSWRWRISSHIKHRHTLTVVAYDNIGNYATKELFVCRFF